MNILRPKCFITLDLYVDHKYYGIVRAENNFINLKQLPIK